MTKSPARLDADPPPEVAKASDFDLADAKSISPERSARCDDRRVHRRSPPKGR